MKKILIGLGVALTLSLNGCGGGGGGSGGSGGGGDAVTPSANGTLVNSSLARNNPAGAPLADTSALVEGNTQFAFDLYGYLSASRTNANRNLFFSPYSISMAMAMANVGAKGATSSQITAAMHFTLPATKLYPAINALDQTLMAARPVNSGETAPKLDIANSMWGEATERFNQPFLDTLAQNFGAGIYTSNFIGDPEGSRAAINNWVAGKTNNKILDLMPVGSVDSTTRLVLVNAIYFLAQWSDKFDPTQTKPGTFYGLSGNSTEQMMHQGRDFPYAAGADWQAVELPYNGNMNFLVIMPNKLSSFESSFTAAKLQSIDSALEQSMVTLSMPRFTMPGQSVSLNDALEALGVTAAFNPGAADLSDITSAEKLYVSAFIHKAYIDVDEKGTEAAAATGVGVVSGAAAPHNPVTLTIDHPFIFLIRDASTGSILFMGRFVGS